MKKVINNLEQETFDYFPSLDKWPEGYHTYIIEHFKLQSTDLYKQVMGMDIETQGLDPYNKTRAIISIAISPYKNIAYSHYLLKLEDVISKFGVQVTCNYSSENLVNLLSDPNIILIGHNIKYDVNWIRVKLGIDVKCMLFDTMFAQYLIDENIESNSLEHLTDNYIPEMKGYKQGVDRNRLDLMAKDDILIYNCKDADASRRLYDVFVPKLKEGGYDKLMVTSSLVLPVLSKMEVRGVYLDKEYAHKTQTKVFNEMVSLRYQMADTLGTTLNPDSPRDLGKALYKVLGFSPVKHTPTGQPSTDSEAISYLVDQCTEDKQNRFINSLLQYKKKLKLITTYYQPIERWTKYDGRVHTNYSLGRQRNEEASGGTVTGRLSSNNPNLQNIPRGKEHRGMFAATPTYTLLDGDFSQLELRVAAFLSQEPAMMDAFQNNLDIHTKVMSDITGISYNEIEERRHTDEEIKRQRVAIKRVNFGILYGVQAKRLQRLLRLELGIHYEEQYCKSLIQQWLDKYGRIREWLEAQKVQAVSQGWVGMPLGQRRRLPSASFDRTKEAAHALSQAINFPIQSLASWICLIGLRLLDDYFNDIKLYADAHIIMQVHDSITSEIKPVNRFLLHPESIKMYNLTTLDDIKVDIRKIMEVEVLNYLHNIFGITFNVPLIFDVEIKERWS